MINPEIYIGLKVSRKTSMEAVLLLVCERFDVSREEITGKTRKREIVDARHVFCYLVNKYISKKTLSVVGAHINRDHASVIHGIKKTNNLMVYNGLFRKKVETCCLLIEGFDGSLVGNHHTSKDCIGYYYNRTNSSARYSKVSISRQTSSV